MKRLRQRVDRAHEATSKCEHQGVVIYTVGETEDEIAARVAAAPRASGRGHLVVPDDLPLDAWLALAAAHYGRTPES